MLCYTDDFHPADEEGTLELGGSGHYRLAAPYDALAEAGAVSAVGYTRRLESLPSGELVGTDGETVFGGADLIVAQRWMFPDTAERIRRAQAVGQRVIIDCDDDYWASPRRHVVHPLMEILKRHMTGVLRAADAVTCSTVPLARRCAKLAGHDVFVLRNAVDRRQWAPQVDLSGRLGLGWVGCLEYRDDDFAVAGPALREFLTEHPGVSFTWVGWTPDGRHLADAVGVERDRMICHPRQPLRMLRQTLAESRINVGIAPMRPSPFNEAKSWLKALEYGVLGIPTVASPTHEYREWGAARLAERTSDWSQALWDMTDEVERKDAGRVAADRAAECDITLTCGEWADVVRSLT